MSDDKEQQNPMRPALWYWLLGLVIFVLFQSVAGLMSTAPIAYSDFKQLLYAGKVNEVQVSDTSITGSLKPGGLDAILPKDKAETIKCSPDGGCPFSTVRVTDPDLVPDLEAQKVRYVGQVKSEWLATLLAWVFPVLLLFWLWGSVAKRGGMMAGGLFDIGKSKARVYVQSKTGVTFDDVAGIDEAKE